MFCSRTSNNMTNKIHERALKLILNDLTAYDFTSKTLYLLIVYGSISNKAPSIDTTSRAFWNKSGNINIFYTEICSDSDRRPWIKVASRSRCRTVAAKLLLLHCKYVIIRLYPSITMTIKMPRKEVFHNPYLKKYINLKKYIPRIF